MLEAKDTVMEMRWMNKSVQEDQDKLLLDQAEISFFKGEEQGMRVGLQLGRKVVVEWIESHDKSTCMDCSCAFDFKEWDWQAKLKEWDIEKT